MLRTKNIPDPQKWALLSARSILRFALKPAKGLSACCLIACAFLPDRLHGGSEGRIFGDFAISAEQDDSILQDAYMYDDTVFPSYAGIGWRGRISRKNYVQTYYRLSLTNFSQHQEESFRAHYAKSSWRRHISGPATLNISGGYASFVQPKLNTQSYSGYFAKPGIELWVFPGTGLKVFYSGKSNIYPHYDLDYSASGFEAEIIQDLTLYGYVKTVVSGERQKFSERELFLDSSGSLSGKLRKDDVSSWRLEGGYERPGLMMSAGFISEKQDSNGNYLDYGPGQDQYYNPINNDETLVNDYYSISREGPYTSLYARFFRDFYATFFYGYSESKYNGRFAKDISDNFLANSPERKDKEHLITGEITRLIRFRNITFGTSAGGSWKNNVSNDELSDFTNNKMFVRLRSWF
ncbi:hypothetical protein ACFL6Y_02930 [Elusimicrobiota bacterium]